MKIWIDLTNSPHVNFFLEIIRELQTEHEVVLTCRPLANTIELLELFNFPYRIVGGHYGKNTLKKGLGFPIRVLQLLQHLRKERIDVAISHSSFYSPVVSRLLGMRCIYLNDNEFAAGNRIAFLFADKIMVPEFLDSKKVQRQWASPHKIVKYPGVKEGVYLCKFRNGPSNKGDGYSRKTIYVRPEPYSAQYYKGGRNFLDEVLASIKDEFRVTVLPRGKVQEAHYRQAKFNGIEVPERSMELGTIAADCDLFIGAGGTMTREIAVLGIPTISVYQDELLDVDRFLINEGLLVHKPDLTAGFVLDFMANRLKRPPSRHLLEKGQDAHKLIIRALLQERTADA